MRIFSKAYLITAGNKFTSYELDITLALEIWRNFIMCASKVELILSFNFNHKVHRINVPIQKVLCYRRIAL